MHLTPPAQPRRTLLRALTLAVVAGLSSTTLTTGCSTIDSAPRVSFERDARWAVIPLANFTETPQAGSRAATIVDAVLRSRGFTDLRRAPNLLSADSLTEPQDAQATEKALTWARGAGIRYVVTGSVSEWRYKVGVDGEPAVGLTLQVLDLSNNSERVLWSASGARSGWSREALTGVAQKLVRDLTAPLTP